MRGNARVLIAVLAVSLVSGAQSASAATVSSHLFLDSFDGATTASGSFNYLGDIDVNRTDSSFYLTDLKNPINNFDGVIDKLDVAGSPLDFSAFPSSAISSYPGGTIPVIKIAVDNSAGPTAGNIYIAGPELFSNPGIFAFDQSGEFLFHDPGSLLPGGIGNPKGLAVDSSGHLFISRGDFIYKLTASNSGVSYDQENDPGINTEAQAGIPTDIAFDSVGNLYVQTDQGTVDKYNPAGGPEGEFLGQIDPGPGPSNNIGAIAIDPANDHLFLTHSNSILEYDAAGTPLSEFGIGKLQNPSGIAVDPVSSVILVPDGVYESSQRVARFGPPVSVTAPTLTIEPASGVFVVKATLNGTVNPAGVSTEYRFEYRVQGQASWTSTTKQSLAADSADHAASAQLEGLQPSTTYEYRLVGLNSDAGVSTDPSLIQTLTTLPNVTPSVSIDPASQVTSASAHLSGTVNPQGAPTSYRFEYSSDQANWSSVPGPDNDPIKDDQAGEGSTAVTVQAELTNLDPNTTYYVRLFARNSLGDNSTSGETSLMTSSAVPILLTSPAAEATETTVTLHATLLANGPGATYHFEWGADTGYENTAPVPDVTVGSDSGSESVTVSEQLSNLIPNTTYHFRVVVANSHGTVTGTDRTFKTLDPNSPEGLPEGRVYEKVSPREKAGASVARGTSREIYQLTQVSTSGDAVAYATKAVTFEGSSAHFSGEYLARRTSSGWSTMGLNPPGVKPSVGAFGFPPGSYGWFSDDLSLGATYVNGPLHPGDPDVTQPGNEEGAGSTAPIYLRNTLIPDDEGNSAYRLITVPSVDQPQWRGASVVGASADGTRVVFNSGSVLTPDSPSANSNAYVWADGTVHYLHGDTVGYGSSIYDLHYPGSNPISDDGSRVFFHGGGNISEYRATLQVNENLATTRTIAPNSAFEGAKASDGSIAFFTSDRKLTDDATANSKPCNAAATRVCLDLYRWDANATPGQEIDDLTTADSSGAGVLGTISEISEDATKVYFVATGNLAPGATKGIPNIYLWQQGVGLSHIATLSAEEEGRRDRRVWGKTLLSVGHIPNEDHHGGAVTSPDGEHLLFESFARLTPYDNAGHKQVYLYDLATDQITCVSCNRTTSSSRDDAFLSIVTGISGQNEYLRHGGKSPTIFTPKNLSSDGKRIFFDTTEALLPFDTNGKSDVYEWTNGELFLISSGSAGTDSNFIGAGSDGGDVFFVTGEQLTRSDTDELLDIYDARINGQREPSPRVPCVGDECQGTPLAPPIFADLGSTRYAGPGNLSAASKRRKCGESRVRKHGRCIRRKAKSGKPRNHRGAK